MPLIVPVILCGGSGSRLWPRSRKALPKPFLPLLGDETLFQAALARCPTSAGFAPPVVVTGHMHVAHVDAQLDGLAGAKVIVEPFSRNTAAAIALAAHRLNGDDVMIICPSDHHIGNAQAFLAAARTAAALASEGWLVSFGIRATAPETGFGYLKRGAAITDGAYRTAQFIEKPDIERARAFLAEGSYAWNGGIFAFRAKDFLEELATFRPLIAAGVADAVGNGAEDDRYFHPDAGKFFEVPSESVDYAIMENTDRAAMVPVDMDWSDIGSWHALQGALERDAEGNATCGRGETEMIDCRNVLINSDGPRVSAIGLEDVIIVVDGDDIMITSAAGAQKVGMLSGALNQ